jgi:hypothetical protein
MNEGKEGEKIDQMRIVKEEEEEEYGKEMIGKDWEG